MIKYPHIKKNAAATNTLPHPDSTHTPKVTLPGCSSFLKNLHGHKHAHGTARLTNTVVVLQCVYDSTLHAALGHCQELAMGHGACSVFAIDHTGLLVHTLTAWPARSKKPLTINPPIAQHIGGLNGRNCSSIGRAWHNEPAS